MGISEVSISDWQHFRWSTKQLNLIRKVVDVIAVHLLPVDLADRVVLVRRAPIARPGTRVEGARGAA